MSRSGDGSTLNLDFTAMGGTLDPRITFTRASNATFINSQGYVQYADANELKNTTMLTSSNWTQTTTGGSPSVTINGDNTVTFASVAGIATWLQGISIVQGLPISFSIEITALTNTDIRISDFIGAGFGFTGQVYKYTNAAGVTSTPNSLDVLPGIGLYTVTATTTGTYGNLIFGTGCNGFNKTGSVTVARPQVQYGTVAPRTAYVPNSSTSLSKYDAPRFDYDPTTIAAKGLLLEAPATNLTTYSEDFANINWQKDNSGGSAPVVTTVSAATPANGASVNQIVFNKTGGAFSRIQRTSVGTTSAPYTMSVWMRTVTGTANVGLRIGSDILGFNCAVTTTWTRFQYTFTLIDTNSSAQIMLWDNIVGNDETATVYVWGCQVEAGSQATSYIPTGAATVARAVDTAIIAAGTNFSSWYTGATSGTFVANWYGNASSATARSVIATNDQTTKHLHLYQTASALTLRLADFNAVGTVTTANSLTANALTKGAFSYASTATSLCLNGGTVATGTLAFTVAPTWLSIGGPSTNGTSITATDVMLNNSIRTLKYFPARLSDGQIQGLTT